MSPVVCRCKMSELLGEKSNNQATNARMKNECTNIKHVYSLRGNQPIFIEMAEKYNLFPDAFSFTFAAEF